LSTEENTSPSRPGGSKLWTWVTSHRTASIAIGVGAVAVIAAAAIGIPAGVSTSDHANADASYQAARVKATAQYRQDVKAQKELATALAAATELKTQLGQIQEQAKAGQYLPDAQIQVIAAELGKVSKSAALTPGNPVLIAKPAGTPSSTTAQLQQETKRLNALVAYQKPHAAKTAKEAPEIFAQTAKTNESLAQIVSGLEKKGDVAAVPPLDVDAAGVITALAKAGQVEKDALTAAATAAKEGVKAGKAPAPFLLDYLAKAKAVHDSHDATVAAEAAAAEAAAAEAAARAGQSTYTDPKTGQTKSTPRSGGSSGGGGGGGSNGGGGGGGGTGGGGGAGGTGGTGGTGGGGGGGYTPPPVDHTPHVVANGSYTPGCNGVQMYSQTTSSGGQIVINVGYPYKYSTFSTDDGWGVTVFGCA